MYSINEMIQIRQQFEIGGRNCPWPDELLAYFLEDDPKGDCAFITFGSILMNQRAIKAIQEKYHIAGVYRIGSIFTNTHVPFYILHLSTQASSELRIALFNGVCYPKQKQSKDMNGLSIPDTYSEEWTRFSKALEAWMNGGEVPESNELEEYRIVSEKQLYNGSLCPETYSKESIELRELLERQNSKSLSALAEVLLPRTDDRTEETVRVLKPKDMEYPLDISSVSLEHPTSILLQKGDIVLPRVLSGKKAYLFNYEGNEPIYASQSLAVIRCKSILPEYLYFYLNSDVAIRVLNAGSVGSTIKHLTAKNIGELLVAPPTQDEQKYIADFNILTNVGIRSYEQFQRLNDYYAKLSRIQDKTEQPQAVEDILNLELARTIRAYREDQLRAFLSDDLKELNACYRGKAYKATLILAGSILEAVLIDWLSEMHHRNYFEEDYYVTDKYGHERRADLIDLIDEIKYLRRPNWAAEAAKAHAIRKKRNLVHAKLCLQSDEINEDVCREVISYLRDVLRTRGITSRKESRR